MKDIKLIKHKGIHFLWFTKKSGRHCAIHWECQPPIWWKPRLEKYAFGWRIGWLWFALGHINIP